VVTNTESDIPSVKNFFPVGRCFFETLFDYLSTKSPGFFLAPVKVRDLSPRELHQ